MSSERSDRILGAALLQGKLDWALLREALLKGEVTLETGSDVLRLLVEEGLLQPSDVAGLDSTEAGLALENLPATRGEDIPLGAEAATGAVLMAMSIPEWRQYRNLRFVGEGGMGRIYKGFDGTLRRVVALKFLRRTDSQFITRFMHEAQLQAGLEHPNICRVYEVGEWQGQAYLAMQFIKGDTLEACAKALTLREKVEILEAVASAMHYAHRQGLIHRDLKPANIMVERGEAVALRPFILDFGLARGLVQSGFTVDGQVVGTYHFMAPEQARGATGEMDRRTDVYALGATLYAVLADKPPFWDAEGVEVLNRTLHQEPVPLRQILPELPEDLETVVQKCLEKEPARRYESARALAEDLRRWLDDEPILARKATLRQRIAKYAHRHKALVTISAFALVAVLTAGGMAATSWATARTRARHAARYGQEAERLEAMARYIHLLPAHDIQGERVVLRTRMAALAGERARSGPLSKGPLAYALGRGAMALGAAEEAHQFFQEALQRRFDGPDLRFALGRAQGTLYQKALDAAQRIGDASLRKAEEARAEREWLKPALANLQQGAGTALQGAAFEQALLDFYGHRFASALAKAREAFAQAPWFYEAKRLEADIVHARAMADKDPKTSLPELERAVVLLQEARRVAPSDPSLPLGIARVWRDHMLRSAYIGQDGPEALEACGTAAQEALALDPGLADAEVVWAQGYGAAAMGKAFRNLDVGGDAEAGIRHAKLAQRLDPGSLDALQVHLSLLSRLAWKNLTDRQRPDAYLTEMEALADRILARSPLDPRACTLMGSLHRFRFTRLSQAGASPWEAFEAALRYLHPASQRFPDYSSLQQGLGSLWLERAEHERVEGLVPRESVRLAHEAYQRVVARNPNDFLAVGAIGTIQLVLADALHAAGEDPRSALDKAETQLQAAVSLHPGSRDDWEELAECALIRAEHALEHGGNAQLPLARAQECLARIRALDSVSLPMELRGLLVSLRTPGLPQVEGLRLLERADQLFQRPDASKLRALAKFHSLPSWLAYARFCVLRDAESWRRAHAALNQLLEQSPRHPHGVQLKRLLLKEKGPG